MNRCFRLLAAGLVIACVGCATRGYTRISRGLGAAASYALPESELPRRPLAVDASAVPDPAEILPAALPEDTAPFQAMTEGEVQDLSAARSVPANLLLQETDAVAAQGTRRGVKPEAVDVTRRSLQAQSIVERNRSAASALETLLLLAEAEDGLNRLAGSLREIDGMQADLQQVRTLGLASPVSQTDIENQRLGLLHRIGETQGAERDLNRKLAELLALDDGEVHRIWPEVELVVDAEPLDPETEVAIAMATRADLALLGQLRHSTSPDTLPAIRQALGASGGGLGTALATSHILGHGDTGESAHRRDQLDTLWADRRRSVAREVRTAVAAVQQALRQVAVSKQQVEVQNQRLENLRQQKTIGAATPLDVRRARLDLITTEQQLVHDVVQWKIAQVRLRAAQGRLAADSGYYPSSGAGGANCW